MLYVALGRGGQDAGKGVVGGVEEGILDGVYHLEPVTPTQLAERHVRIWSREG